MIAGSSLIKNFGTKVTNRSNRFWLSLSSLVAAATGSFAVLARAMMRQSSGEPAQLFRGQKPAQPAPFKRRQGGDVQAAERAFFELESEPGRSSSRKKRGQRPAQGGLMTDQQQMFMVLIARKVRQQSIEVAVRRQTRNLLDRRVGAELVADNVRGLARPRERAAQENVKRNFEAANALSDLPGPFQALRRKRPTGIMGAGRVVLFRSDAVAHEIEIHGKALKPWAGCCANG